MRTIGTNRATTLVVTTAGDRRARNLSRIAESEGAESWRFASLAAVEFEGLMGRVWQCPGSDGLSDLSECFHWDEKENG